MKRSIIILAVTVLGGCAILSGPIERAADGVAKGVSAYCVNFTSDQRAEFGDMVRERAAPNEIIVACQ